MVLDLKTQEESTVVNTEIPSDPTPPVEETIEETEETVQDIIEEPVVELTLTDEEKKENAIRDKNIKKFQEKQKRAMAERIIAEKLEAQRHLSAMKKAEMDAKERADKKAKELDTIKALKDSAKLANDALRQAQISRNKEYIAQKEFEKSNTPESLKALQIATQERIDAEVEEKRTSTVANDARTRLKLANWRL